MKQLLIILLFTSVIMAKIPDIVSISWLKEHYDDKSLVIIDVRDSKKFKQGHLKKAWNVPVFEKLFYGKEMLMPSLTKLKEIFSNAGIDEKSNIIVYGSTNPIWAARFYWISKVLGANNVGILKVNFKNWEKGYFPTTKELYKPTYKDFIPKIDNTIMSTKLDVLTSMKKSYIIDGRPLDFYIGEKSHAKRSGHIPTSLNFPGSQTYNKNGSNSTIKDFDNLKKIYSILPQNRPIILYCEDGADAAMNFLVLNKLGYNVSVYDGSWLEWGNDKHLPIETKVNQL